MSEVIFALGKVQKKESILYSQILESVYWTILDYSGVANGGQGEAECPPPPFDSEKFAKNSETREKIRKMREKEGKNQEGSFTLPLLTNRAGYAAAGPYSCSSTVSLRMLLACSRPC